ncbi:MAG: helix-turn-helix domain containing protein [Actinomycetota bacterium]|jgi:AcrR family transcriptional regulator|nr:helix-turn-helix domain containing protein [Actinomycetota bacterium]MDA8341759.1 helix-turn-helix domain containing protein [Actinomycetota bacterium]
MTATPPVRDRRIRAVGDEQKAARRIQILRAAKTVFAEHGFQAATMSAVARAAGLSYGAVYWYFGSKDALFHALIDLEDGELRAAIAAAVASVPPDDPERLLTSAVEATFRFFEADRDAVQLIFRDCYSLGGKFEDHLFRIRESYVDDIEAFLAAARARGALVDAPARVAAFSIAALIGQLAHRRLSIDDGLDAAVVAEFTVHLVLDGLRPR